MHLIQAIVEHEVEHDITEDSQHIMSESKNIEETTTSSVSSSIISEGSEADALVPQDQLQNEESPSQSFESNSSEEPDGDEDAEAISVATKAADENYTPSQSLLSSSSPYPLIRSVDGISLKKYNYDPSRFSAKDVSVPLRGNLSVPIHVTTSGSVVDYTVGSTDFDIAFGVIAEREEGVTVVKEKTRQDSHLQAVTGRFLVGSVPCALIFTFDNQYSWFREKKISYKIKVTPPSVENIVTGRRTRAKSALAIVQKDKASAESRLERVSSKHGALLQEIERLDIELQEKRKSLGVVEKESSWLKERVQLRDVQEGLLTRRLVEGWEDEVSKKVDGEEDEVERAEV
jgi:hypothetical protein